MLEVESDVPRQPFVTHMSLLLSMHPKWPANHGANNSINHGANHGANDGIIMVQIMVQMIQVKHESQIIFII